MTAKRPSLSFIPPLLPNQTIYSWGAVFHEMSGNNMVDETRIQLFGTSCGRWNFHFPNHLESLCASTQLQLGTPEVIFQTATTLPYYVRFKSAAVIGNVLKQVRGNCGQGLAKELGMTQGAEYAHPPRRSCHECILVDQDAYGFAYWHRDHQLPGVLVCQKHGTPLLALPYDRVSGQRDVFLWPYNDWNRKNVKSIADWSDATLNALKHFAQTAADMAEGELAGGYSTQKMKNACHLALHDRALTAADGSMILSKALSDYNNHYVNVESLPEISTATKKSISPLMFVLSGKERRAHPLEWMLVIDWLFEDWATFQKVYERANRE